MVYEVSKRKSAPARPKIAGVGCLNPTSQAKIAHAAGMASGPATTTALNATPYGRKRSRNRISRDGTTM